MHRAAKRLACLAAGAVCLLSAPAFADDIYVYQARDGSRLITDHPRVEPGYRLVKVYSQTKVWEQTGTGPRPSARPRPSAYDDLIDTTAHQMELDPMLIKSVMHAESAFNPDAVSSKGASGLMQLMPATARRYGVSSIFDPRQNVVGGARYLSYLLDRYNGDLELALAGYNAGENAVDQTGGIPPYPETRHYVKKVMQLYRGYRNKGCERQVDDDSFSGRVISCSASLLARSSDRSAGNVGVNAASGDSNDSGAALLSADASAEEGQWRHID